MTSETPPDAPQGKKALPNIVLFIHGFGSSSRTWNKMRTLLKRDKRFRGRYAFRTWNYPTKWFELNLIARIPRLDELGSALYDEIDSPKYAGRELTLVGHSQGGLVILSYFAKLLRGEAVRLRRVRQAIFFATPTQGSTTGMSLRLFASSLFSNAQEITLRVLNPDVAEIRERVRADIVGATADTDRTWRVPIHALCGLQDDIVPEASARGVFDSVKMLPGNHLTIHQPKHRGDPRYTEFVELLLCPGGQAHRFEVERYEHVIKVEPRPPQKMVTRSLRVRQVAFDNFATLTRTVTFAQSNRCRDRFKIAYRVGPQGCLETHLSHPNEATAEETGFGGDTGEAAFFAFTPRAGEEYSIVIDLYNSFPEGGRDLHFHLGDYNSHVQRLSYRLDLSAYLAAHYTIEMEPVCYFQSRDLGHTELCRQIRSDSKRHPISDQSGGVYTWEFQEIEQGVVEIVWDVAKRKSRARAV